MAGRRATPRASQPALGWLLVVVSTAKAHATLRVHVWRKLRSLGGLYLQQSVCVLPDRADTAKAVRRLLDRVDRDGGRGQSWQISFSDLREEEDLVERFNREREDEYSEVVSRAPALLEELATEQTRGRMTYPELEESEADLARLRAWLARIQARDYFTAPGAAAAVAAVERCAQALAAFEAAAEAAETPALTSSEDGGVHLWVVHDG